MPWEQTLAFVPKQFEMVVARNDLVSMIFADAHWPWDHLSGARRLFNRMNRSFDVALGSIAADTLPMDGAHLAHLLLVQRRLRRADLPVAAGPYPGTFVLSRAPEQGRQMVPGSGSVGYPGGPDQPGTAGGYGYSGGTAQHGTAQPFGDPSV